METKSDHYEAHEDIMGLTGKGETILIWRINLETEDSKCDANISMLLFQNCKIAQMLNVGRNPVT